MNQLIATKLVRNCHLNDQQILFGGQLMKWMDEAAYITAKKFTGQRMVTSSVDHIKFKTPVLPGSILRLSTSIAENTGVLLKIKLYASLEDQVSKTRIDVAQAEFCFVCLNDKNQPCRIKVNIQKDEY